MELAKLQIEATGNDELSLLSLFTSDHSQFEELTMELMDYCKANNVFFHCLLLRIDKFAFDVLGRIQEYKKSGLTYAPEGKPETQRRDKQRSHGRRYIYFGGAGPYLLMAPYQTILL